MENIIETENTKEFYNDLDKGNAVIYQQAHNNIMLAITSKITNDIIAGEDPQKITELLLLIKNINPDAKINI